jgi:hypothetical protein
MSTQTIVVIIAVVVLLAAFLYTRTVKADAAGTATLSSGQALGAGILGLGILLLAMPYAAGAISALDFIQSSDFAILSGATYAIGILALLGGILLLVVRGGSSEG